MTHRCIWLPAGSPFPAHADFGSVEAAEAFALGMLGVEVAIVPLGEALGGAEGAAVGEVAHGSTGSLRGREIEETGKR